MAIGNVGTYATVEGGPVDFGKMIAGNIDKYQEGQALQEKLKQDKQIASEKLRADRLKDIKAFGDIPLSGNKDVSDTGAQAVRNLREIYNANYDAAGDGDPVAKRNIDQVLAEVDKLKQVPEALNARSEEYAKNPGKYNLNYLSEQAELGKSLGHGKSVSRSDGHGGLVWDLYPVDDDGNITSEIPIKKDVTTMSLIQGEKIPLHYDYNDDVKAFRENNQMALSEFYNPSNTMKTGLKKITPTLQANIDYAAKAASTNDNAMAQLMIDFNMGKKSGDYTEKERLEVEKKYKERLQNTFQESTTKDYTKPTQAGGSGNVNDKKDRPVMRPGTIMSMGDTTRVLLTNGKSMSGKGFKGISVPGAYYDKDATGTKQIVKLWYNPSTREMMTSRTSASSAGSSETQSDQGYSETKSIREKTSATRYASNLKNGDDFSDDAQALIGTRYTGTDGNEYTLESTDYNELLRFAKSALKGHYTEGSGKTNKKVVKTEAKGAGRWTPKK